MHTTPISHVAVVGGGTIGASWAALFLARGLGVAMHDPAPDARAQTLARIHAAWPALMQAGLVVADAMPERIRFENDLEAALDKAEFVQENAPEREAFKIELFSRMDAVLPAHALIASSSSGLLMSRLQSGCRFPERCLIGHPFNPPHLIPLVEVVGGERTAPEALARAMDFYRSLGKYPIRLNKEVPGHIANRLQAALWREAVHLVAEDVASVADIDAAVAQGPGLRWALFGPHMTFNLGGGASGLQHFMDHLLGPMQAWWDDLGQPELTPELQRKLVAGVQSEASGRTLASLATERDQQLGAILALLRSARPGASTE